MIRSRESGSWFVLPAAAGLALSLAAAMWGGGPQETAATPTTQPVPVAAAEVETPAVTVTTLTGSLEDETPTAPPDPGSRRGTDPDLVYPTIEAEIGTVPTAPSPHPRIRVDPLPGTMALTFDDGPDPVWTPVILDILRDRGVKATFFVIGWKVDAHPEIAQRIVDEGHSLQSHAYHHHRLTIKSSAYVGSLIDDTAAAIFDATGTTPVCLRPPGGFTNSRVAGVAAEHGHTIVLWTPNGNSLDYSHHSVSGVLRRAAGWEAGEVALLHDVWGWLHDDALPVLIDEIESRGIGFSTICVPTDVDPVPETS